MGDLARDVSAGSLALRVVPAVILVGLGFALAYGWIGVHGMRSYALGAGSTVEYRDGADIVIDPAVRSGRGVESDVHLTSGTADFVVAGGGRSRFSGIRYRGDDAVIVYTPAARIVASRTSGSGFLVTAEPNRTTVTCRRCNREVRVFSRAELEYVPQDDATIVVPLMFLVR